MPTYDYRCEANKQVVEVMHRLNEKINTWGELCEKAGIDPGKTPIDSAVARIITGGNIKRHHETMKLESILPK
ncbi:MAG: zinc ribbon domain-containing protein [Gammaproteobacteria bacterium]|nr:zinc ribbon domain-containing protein [Gammaproteobacteria bacterium]